MLVEVLGRAMVLSQGDREVLLADVKITFNFIDILSGSGHYETTPRDILIILNTNQSTG